MLNDFYPSEISNYYERLGINKSSTQEEIKHTYRELALTWHPDRNPDDRKRAHIEFIAVSEAYENLCGSDTERIFQKQKKNSEPNQKGTYEYYEKMFNEIFKGNFYLSKVSPEFATIMKVFKEFGNL